MEITTRPRSHRTRRVGSRLLLAAVLVSVCLLVPASLGLSQGVVSDGAMGGSLPRGALTLNRPVHSVDQLRVGDVISFPRPDGVSRGEWVTRRVVAIDGPSVVTRGDALPADDPWSPRVEDLDAVLNVAAIPVAGYLQLWVPWLSWAVVALLLALAGLVALVAARRDEHSDHVIVLSAPGSVGPTATT